MSAELVIQTRRHCNFFNAEIITGIFDGYAFEGMVHPKPADGRIYLLGHSRLSELKLMRLPEGHTVFSMIKGFDLPPADPNAIAAANFIGAKLAKLVYGE
jgi:hypothetical protein